MSGGQEGEVEKKVRELGDEIFEKYNSGGTAVNSEGKPYIKKEDLKEFIKQIMFDSGEGDAWNDEDFKRAICSSTKMGVARSREMSSMRLSKDLLISEQLSWQIDFILIV